MENLEEDLTCSVCYALFSDPRVLPCSHTFCKSCLDNVLQLSVTASIWRPLHLPLKCPNCRSVTELPSNGVYTLPVNVCLRAIVEKYQRDGQPRSPACPEHPGQPLNVYCVQDRELICGFCLTVGRHRGHAIDDLQSAYVKERAAPVQLLEGLRGDQISSLAEHLRQEKVRSESLVQEDREVVAHFFQELELILAEKQDQFMRALDGASVLLAETYDPLVEQLKELQVEESALISLSSSIEEEGQPLVYLEKVHQLRARVNALNQIVLPQVPCLHIAPRAEEFIEEHWTRVTVRELRDGPIPDISCCHPHRHSVKSAQKQHEKRFWCSSVFLVLFVLVLVCGSFFVSSGITASLQLHDIETHLCCILHNIETHLSSYVYTLGQNTYQQLLTCLNILHTQ
ncbi:tripartite motif-containing protein 59 [Triplophysa rosa]|uniref:Tripartite motif-containing protein 59 n=1 Tax=Triplophysa rosa TaxID=992332 RepID=A0A9W7TPF5_TRIRA|nr:tripartite motif-containing protein 59 [Triplophysa rosa]XP_057207524.1 tripartite motif-containing protein 59 [Triplophysa rosa]KAI7800411.1 putative tripartite motif-containing protein 59 [Triplophysa rosa]